MIRTAYAAGIKPAELWDMELWEFNCCVREARERQEAEAKETITRAWLQANLTNAAMAGKLKPLKNYIQAEEIGDSISIEEFERLLAERNEASGT